MTDVTLYIGTVRFGPTLSVARAPLFLRFVYRCGDWKTLDSLDQLDDTPDADETIVVAKYKSGGSMHIDRIVKNCRVGEWRQYANYEFYEPQPADAEVRDNAKWREWCLAQPKGTEATK